MSKQSNQIENPTLLPKTFWVGYKLGFIKVTAILLLIICVFFAVNIIDFSFFMGLISTGAMIVFAPLIALVIHVILVYSARLKELAILAELKLDGVEHCCTSCSSIVEPTFCHCFNCQRPHNVPLLPNKYGAYHHECAYCQEELSTSLITRIQQDLSFYCSNCENEMPKEIGINKYFAFIENPSDNSSSLCYQVANKFAIEPLQNLKSETKKGQQQYRVIHKKEEQEHPYILHFHGVKSSTNLTQQDCSFFKNTETILFIINPLNTNSQTSLDTLRSLLQALEKYRTPDEIKAINFNLILMTSETIKNSDVEHFIEHNLHEKAFIHHVKQQFDSVSFYAHETIAEESLELPIMVKELCDNINVNL